MPGSSSLRSPTRIFIDSKSNEKMFNCGKFRNPCSGCQVGISWIPKRSRNHLICKKSGQLIKSSLKSSKSAAKNSTLSVVTIPQSSKSEPLSCRKKVYTLTPSWIMLNCFWQSKNLLPFLAMEVLPTTPAHGQRFPQVHFRRGRWKEFMGKASHATLQYAA